MERRPLAVRDVIPQVPEGVPIDREVTRIKAYVNGSRHFLTVVQAGTFPVDNGQSIEFGPLERTLGATLRLRITESFKPHDILFQFLLVMATGDRPECVVFIERAIDLVEKPDVCKSRFPFMSSAG